MAPSNKVHSRGPGLGSNKVPDLIPNGARVSLALLLPNGGRFRLSSALVVKQHQLSCLDITHHPDDTHDNRLPLCVVVISISINIIMDFTSLSPQQVLDLGKPCKEFEEVCMTYLCTYINILIIITSQLLKTWNPPKFDLSDPSKALAALRNLVSIQDQADQKDPDIDEQTFHAPSRDKFSLPLKVFRPTTSSTPEANPNPPLIVIYFAGAFTLGSPTTMAPLARILVKHFHAVVIAPTYRLAPEHPFPTAFNDGWDTLSWVAAHASSALRADPAKGFIVGGISAGGNIANTLAHLARDTALQPPITGVWLSCIGVRLAPKDAHLLPEKYRARYLSREQPECVNSVVTTPAMVKLMAEFVKPDVNSKLYAPLLWPEGHKGLPKTCSQVCGMEASRDEVLIFDDMLKGEGVETRVDLYEGLPHCFWHASKALPQARRWERDTTEGFGWLLGS